MWCLCVWCLCVRVPVCVRALACATSPFRVCARTRAIVCVTSARAPQVSFVNMQADTGLCSGMPADCCPAQLHPQTAGCARASSSCAGGSLRACCSINPRAFALRRRRRRRSYLKMSQEWANAMYNYYYT